MSLRPAQDLVAESSKFSLRQFFEAAPSPSPSPPPSSLPTEAALETMLPVNGGQAYGEAAHSPPLQPVHLNGIPRASAPTSTSPREHKFTFNGLMPNTTPIQMQHRLLQQHQQTAIQAGVSKTVASPPASDASEMLRLKAQVVTLTDRVSHLNANLASTSESVVRGNKALTTERAQFHAKFATVTKKLEATSAALAEAEALPREAIKNAKLLNAKILELQEENNQLVQTRETLEETLSGREAELSELRARQQQQQQLTTAAASADADAELQEKHAELQSKYEVLSAQHSLVLERQFELNESLEQHEAMLREASAEVLAANERLEASKVEVATADGLVEDLDAKLAAVRLEYAAKADEEEAAATAAAAEAAEAAEAALALAEAETAACCPQTVRCEALEAAAKAARDKLHGAEAVDCECLTEEWRFAEGMAKRARAALTHGTTERVMVAHMFTDEQEAEAAACIDARLDACIHRNPLLMGSPYERSLMLHQCCADDCATTGVQEAVEAVLPERTSTYVKAISEDLKFHMDGSQALYKSSSATGLALRM